MAVLCPGCRAPLPAWSLQTPTVSSFCPTCLGSFTANLFPALFRHATAIDRGAPVEEADARCYEHVSRVAVSACGHCGRFVCTLCEVRLGNEVWCPACLQGRQAGAALTSLETQRTLYDSIALALATWPLLLLYPAILTSPMVLYLVIRYRKRPSSMVPRNKWRFILAFLLALLELALFAAMIVTIILVSRKAGHS